MGRTASGFAAIHDAESAGRAIDRFERFPKILSWLVLHSAGLPTLPGVIVSRWDLGVARGIEDFASTLGWDQLLVRSDAAAESGRSPRGGYLIAPEQVETEVRALLDQGRAVFLLEPASPFDDLYSMSMQPDVAWHEWRLEIVGAGFDASDLKRGDATPHEQIRGRLGARGFDVLERVVAKDDVFQATRAIRVAKAARLLHCSPDEVPAELSRLGETLLLDFQTYRPIPYEDVAAIVHHAARVRQVLVGRHLDDRRITISASLLGQTGEPVFWDLVWPGSKYRIGDG
jgi:hypothetical protein